MSGDVTEQALSRLSHLPNSTNPADLIAGQKYYDVEFTGGSITGITPSLLPTPLAISDGGTGQITANAALNALLPTQVGQSGKALKTDGTNTLWSSDIDTGITQLTGDVTAGPGSNSQVATLATVNSNVGSFGSSTSIPTITVNAKGLITAISGNSVNAAAGTLTGTTLASNVVNSSLNTFGSAMILGTPASGTLTNCTIPASAITGTTLASNVVNSSLTSVGTLTSLGISGSVTLTSNTSQSITDTVAGGGWPQYFMRAAGGTIASPSTVGSSTILGQIIGSGHDGGAYRQAGYILFTSNGTVSSGIVPGAITFHTYNASGVDTLALTIDSSQTVTCAGALKVNGLATNIPLQSARTVTGAVATGATLIPFDDTIPQNTEGDQYMSLAITPLSATSVLEIQVTINLTTSRSGGDAVAVALFQDSTANALAAVAGGMTNTTPLAGCVTFTYKMTSGTTSATTFKVRAGQSNAGTLTFNGTGGARLFGGVMASSITITEYLS